MRMTEEIGALMTALAKAQGQMEDAGKDSRNPHFKSRYATLAAVRQAVRKPFSENGLAVTQFPRTGEGFIEVETFLAHGESGQYISDILRMPVPQFTPQGIGAVITYAKRYALMAIAAVASSDDDDDANAGETPVQQDRSEWPARQAPPPKVAKPALTAVKADPVAALRTKARGIAKEGAQALGTWWGTLTGEQCDELDAIYEELGEIAKAADAAEVMRAG
jgi:hypothetical protein